MTNRSNERAEFLATVLTTAVEGGINYWAAVRGYRWGFSDLGHSDGRPFQRGEPAYATAFVSDIDDGPFGDEHEVNIDTIATGLGLLRNGEQRHVAEHHRQRLLLADRTNGEEGDIDAVDADVILQLGMYGEVIYG